MIKLDDIIKEIESEISNYNPSFEYDRGYSICKKYLEKNIINIKSDIKSIDILECLKCLIYALSGKEIDLDECASMANSFNFLFNNDSNSNLRSIANIINTIVDITKLDDEDYNEIIKYFKAPLSKSFLKQFKIAYNQWLSKNPDGDRDQDKFAAFGIYLGNIKKLIQKDKNIINVIEYIRKHPDESAEILDLLFFRKSQMDNNGFFVEKLTLSRIKEIHNDINIFVLAEETRKKEVEREIEKRYRTHNRAIALLREAQKKPEITNAEEIIGCVQSEEIKIKILKWIYEHNNNYNQSLQSKYNELSSNDINKYLTLLSKYKITIRKQDINSILHNSLDDIEEIIKSLPTRELSNDSIVSILKTTTKEIALKVKSFREKGYITSRKVVEYISIYNPEDKKIEMMEISIELLKSLGINPIIFCDQPEYYWVSNEIFKKNINLLGNYKLTDSIKSETRVNFLLEDNLDEKIDILIELGFYDYIKENIELLNYPEPRIKRLILLQQMNIPVEDIETLEEILSSPKFMVDESEIDECIMDYASYMKEIEIPEIPDNPIDVNSESICISLDGNIISLPKIKRQLEKGKTIWEAVFYGTKLTEERYIEIMKSLKPGNVYVF